MSCINLIVKILPTMKKMIIAGIFIIPLLIIGAFWIAGSRLTAPLPESVGNCPDDLVCENIEFASESGSTIKGWFIAGEKGKGAVVLMHGLHGSRLSLIERIRFLRGAGFSVLAFDFQGCGESAGKIRTFGYLESRDAAASIKFIKSKLPDEKIGVIGMSMGGAAFLLQNDPNTADAAILEMVYSTIQKAIENRLNLWLFPGAEYLSPLMTRQFPLRIGVSIDELRPVEKIQKVKCPVFIIAGEKDRHTLSEESQRLFDAANQPKEMWIVPGAEHGDLQKIAARDYQEKVLKFFAETLKTPAGAY